MDSGSIDLLKSSFALLAPRADELAGRFYRDLFDQHPDLRPLFPRGDAAQRRSLLAALGLVMKHIDHLAPIRRGLREMSKWRGGEPDTDRRASAAPSAPSAPPPLVVAHVLVNTMREMTGPAWTPGHARAWTVALTAVAGVVLTGDGQPSARDVA